MSWTARTLPEVSPFFHSALRLRDQKCASPVAIVAASASASICATISTSPDARSVQTAVRRPLSSTLGSSVRARKSVVEGKGGSVLVDLGGRRSIKKKKQ